MAEKGRLKIQCFEGDTYKPVDGARIFVSPAAGNQATNGNIELSTNSMGESDTVDLDAPPLAYSQEQGEIFLIVYII